MHETRTYAERADYIKKAVSKRRRKIREMAVKAKGGKCQVCGYATWQGSLEFHHLDPKKKDFSISVDGTTRSWERVRNEIEKCILLCANCHREVHAGVTQLPVETLG